MFVLCVFSLSCFLRGCFVLTPRPPPPRLLKTPTRHRDGTEEDKESDQKLVFNVDQEAGGDGYGRGGEEEDGDDEAEDEDPDGDEGDDGEEDEEGEEDDEPPPPMNESSGSDCDPSPASKKMSDKGPAAKKKGAGTRSSAEAAAVAAGGGGMANGADKKAFKPTTASEKMKPPAGDATGNVADSPLWTSFLKSRKGADKDLLGVVPLKMWELFETDKRIPRAMKSWYINKVGGARPLVVCISFRLRTFGAVFFFDVFFPDFFDGLISQVFFSCLLARFFVFFCFLRFLFRAGRGGVA